MTRYGVIVENFCERHFTKDLRKKHHKKRWDLTLKAIIDIASNPVKAYEESEVLEIISDSGKEKICKGEFKIFASKVSAKKSGHRFILYINTETGISRVLLIYHKNHVEGPKETTWWQGLIKKNYPEYKKII